MRVRAKYVCFSLCSGGTSDYQYYVEHMQQLHHEISFQVSLSLVPFYLIHFRFIHHSIFVDVHSFIRSGFCSIEYHIAIAFLQHEANKKIGNQIEMCNFVLENETTSMAL